ncbi:MAG TPA: hypothetical protein VFE38_02880 [Edaphobacter sp.]|nr:hypothetical protein [Edaphobacter sp.]
MKKTASYSLFHRALTLLTMAAIAAIFSLTAPGQTTLQNAQNLNIGFNGPDAQFPYMDLFYSATNAYYQSIGRVSMPGNRHCHAYLSYDIAQQPVGSGPLTKEGSRAWFEDWLNHAQAHCDQALITFKYIDGITVNPGIPSVAAYETAIVAFLNTSWAYTGWTGRFDYTAWNEPNNGTPTGDGLTVALYPQRAADFILCCASTAYLRRTAQ